MLLMLLGDACIVIILFSSFHLHIIPYLLNGALLWILRLFLAFFNSCILRCVYSPVPTVQFIRFRVNSLV